MGKLGEYWRERDSYQAKLRAAELMRPDPEAAGFQIISRSRWKRKVAGFMLHYNPVHNTWVYRKRSYSGGDVLGFIRNREKEAARASAESG